MMENVQKDFLKNELSFGNKKIIYYLSPLLKKNNFSHGFFTKTSSDIDLCSFSKFFNNNHKNYFLNQIHSNLILLGSNINLENPVDGDGIICDGIKQNLWIYTADCMPILFADKTNRRVAAIHCGRKGLEKNIIKNLIKGLENLGTSRGEILVAIGPSISKNNYLLDKKSLQKFYEKINSKKFPYSFKKTILNTKSDKIFKHNKQDLIPLDIKEFALFQLLNEGLLNENIEISAICTYDSFDDFHSWRRSKTLSRQWSFISS